MCRYETHKLTTDEIKECVKDLKVLSKADFKRLLKWRLKLREEFLNPKVILVFTKAFL
jgi:hypothetical protein